METGRGDGHPSNFVNFTEPCESFCWLAYIYMLDLTIDGLFSKCTSAQVPSVIDSLSQSSNSTPSKRLRKKPDSGIDNFIQVFETRNDKFIATMENSVQLIVDSQKNMMEKQYAAAKQVSEHNTVGNNGHNSLIETFIK